LRQAWINESLSPEILEYQSELVDRVRSLISNQEEIVEAYEQDPAQALTRMIRFAELNRIKFCLRSYLRKRLLKIEAFAIHIFLNLTARLSPEELEFAQGYIDAENKLFEDSVLQFMPRDYDSLIHQSEAMQSDVPDMIPEPDLDKAVFCHVTEDLGHLEGGLELAEGDILAIRYALVKDFLLQDRIKLL